MVHLLLDRSESGLHAASILARRRSKPTLPYPCRFNSLSLCTNPSIGPLLQVFVSPALTAERSFFRPVAKRCIAGALHASASSSHSSSLSPLSPLTISVNSWVSLRVSLRAWSELQSLFRYSFCSLFSFSSRLMKSVATFLEVRGCYEL